MLKSRGRLVVSFAVAAALIGAACSSDDDTPDGAETTASSDDTSASETSAPTETAATETTAPAETVASDTTVAAGGDADPSAVVRIGNNFLRSGRLSFDPRSYPGNTASQWLYQLYAPLAKVDPTTLEYTPYLAESFELIDDTQMQITLREDATFHDGRPVTSADAKATIEATKANQEAGTALVSASIQRLQEVQIVDDRTFILKMVEPSVLTMYELIVGPETLIAPADAGAEQELTPIGNGPFKFVSYETDQSFELAKYDEFFDADSIQSAGLEFFNLTEGNPQLLALTAGDIDVATDIGPAGIASLEGDSDYRGEVAQNANRYVYLTFCMAPGTLWEDHKAIEALQHVTDRQQIVDTIYDGLVEPSNQFWPKGHPYYDPELEDLFPNDVDAAKQLLEEAGVAEGSSDAIWAPAAIPESQDMALVLNEQWSQAGLSFEVTPSDDFAPILTAASTNPPTHEGGNVFTIENTRAGLQRLTRQSTVGSLVNSCAYTNPRWDEIAGEIAAIAPDDPKAIELWHEASRILLEESNVMILNRKASFVGFSTAVGGVSPEDYRADSEGSFQFNNWYISA